MSGGADHLNARSHIRPTHRSLPAVLGADREDRRPVARTDRQEHVAVIQSSMGNFARAIACRRSVH